MYQNNTYKKKRRFCRNKLSLLQVFSNQPWPLLIGSNPIKVPYIHNFEPCSYSDHQCYTNSTLTEKPKGSMWTFSKICLKLFCTFRMISSLYISNILMQKLNAIFILSSLQIDHNSLVHFGGHQVLSLKQYMFIVKLIKIFLPLSYMHILLHWMAASLEFSLVFNSHTQLKKKKKPFVLTTII